MQIQCSKKTNIAEMTPIFVTKGKMVLDLIKNENLENPVDVQSLFMRYTLDSFGEIGFGVTFELLSGKDLEFPRWFDQAQRMVVTLAVNPIKRFLKEKEFFDTVKNLQNAVCDIIEKKTTKTRRTDRPNFQIYVSPRFRWKTISR